MSKLLLSLRIALSSLGSVLCLLIIAWWVRGYWWADGGWIALGPWEHIQYSAGGGRMVIWFEHKPAGQWFKRYAHRMTEHTPPDAENRIPPFDLAFWPTFARLYTAHWLWAALALSLAAIPWCPKRFTLRTLLATTTLIAAITGVIAWVDRTF
jgi:hypothetical protein